jgi:apolipoprotein N-acyltransferase
MSIKPLLQSHYGELLALTAGLLCTLAFAPFDYAVLALLAMVLLFASCLYVSPKRACFRGYLFGLGQFGLGVSWVYISVRDFGSANIAISLAITSLFIGFWSLFPALATGLFALSANKTRPLVQLMLMPVIWVLVEYFRGYYVLNGFPWLQLAYSQLDTPLSGWIPVCGVYGVGFILSATAAVIVAIIHSKKPYLLPIVVISGLWVSGGFLKTISWTHPIAEPIKVTLIQGNISQDQKWKPDNKIKTLQLYKNLTEQHWDSSLVIWPETSIPAYFSEVNESFLQPLNRLAKQHHTDLIVSLPMYGKNVAEKFNAVMTLGETNAFYRKQHLLPFGEYMPLQPFSGFLLNRLNIRLGKFTPGGNQPLLTAAGFPFITSICYEDVLSELALQQLDNAAFLVNVANDGWFGNSIEPYQHLQLARMRSLETGRYMLRATNTGITAIIAPDSSIVKQAPAFEVATLTGEISPMAGMTVYAGLGDKPIIMALMLLCIALLLYEKVFVSMQRPFK